MMDIAFYILIYILYFINLLNILLLWLVQYLKDFANQMTCRRRYSNMIQLEHAVSIVPRSSICILGFVYSLAPVNSL